MNINFNFAIFIYTIYTAIISLVFGLCKHIEQYDFNTIHHILTIYQNQIPAKWYYSNMVRKYKHTLQIIIIVKF